MTGIGIEFVTGVVFSSIFRLVLLLTIGWCIYSIVRKLLQYDHSGEYKSIKWEAVIFATAFASVFLFDSLSQSVIDETVIETSVSRKQNLPGSDPLSE